MISVVLPCYKSRDQVLDVIRGIGREIDHIIVVDDACPEQTGQYIESNISDERLIVIRHELNQGVGGATLTGFRKAMEVMGSGVIVKLDSDGQMDPSLIPQLIAPIISGEADYAKGNRFYDLAYLDKMPAIRVFGNAGLSFLNKLSTGYWDIMDPTNGFVAIHSKVLARIPLDKLDKRFYFESDLLFRLSTLRARIIDVPMSAHYENEVSNLSVSASILRFSRLHLSRLFKRIFYNYYLRDFNIASINLLLGLSLTTGGMILGVHAHLENAALQQPTPTGIVMEVMLLLLVGFQLLLSFINYDVAQVPRRAIHKSI
jgi:dolichol-phosphate mannosyltransferase